jgi:hypothetical protein
MRLQSIATLGRTVWAVGIASLLSACVATQPLVDSETSGVSHPVKVQVYRAADQSISHYDLTEVQAVLLGVQQTLRDRGIVIQFDVLPNIQVSDNWEDLYSQDILRMSGRIRSENNKQLSLFITNKIWSCGNHTVETTVILGCTPVGSPTVVVQGTVDGASSNYGTTDHILWLHEMGHSVQLGHADDLHRVMTPTPQPYSTELERYEVRQYGNLGESLQPKVVQAAVTAQLPALRTQQMAVTDVVTKVRGAGLHGLDLNPFKTLSDAELLPLAQLLNDQESPSVQANALAVLGQLGGTQSAAVVMTYAQQRPASHLREMKEIAIIALAKNETPDVTDQATAMVIRATRPSFWCASGAGADELKACQRLAHMGIGALAQSSNAQAKAYLTELSLSGFQATKFEPNAIFAGAVGRKPERIAAQRIDVDWAPESSKAAAKFLRKRADIP